MFRSDNGATKMPVEYNNDVLDIVTDENATLHGMQSSICFIRVIGMLSWP